jgi:predicted nucleic acid-binding protein
LDAAYAIALASRSDQQHDKAVVVAGELQKARTRLITTPAVLLEVGNALSKQRFRSAGVQLLESLHGDATVEIVALTEEIYRPPSIYFASDRIRSGD